MRIKSGLKRQKEKKNAKPSYPSDLLPVSCLKNHTAELQLLCTSNACDSEVEKACGTEKGSGH